MQSTAKVAGVKNTDPKNTDPMYWERLLMEEELFGEIHAEPTSTLEAEGLAQNPEDAEILYFGLPAGSGAGRSGIELPDESARSEIEDLEDAAPEDEGDGGESIPTCPVLSPEDFDLIEVVRGRGHAVGLGELFDEIAASPERAVKLVEARLAVGEARGRRGSDEPIFALTSATDEDVRRAVNRAEADRLAGDFEEKVSECSRIASAVFGRLHSLGGACSERETLTSLMLEGHSRYACERVVRELAGAGDLRRLARKGSRSGAGASPILLALAGAGRERIQRAAARLDGTEAASKLHRGMKMKAFAREASVYTRPEERPTERRDLDLAGETFRRAARGAKGGGRRTDDPREVARRLLRKLTGGGPASWRSLASSYSDPVRTEAVLARLEELGAVERRETAHGTMWAATREAVPVKGGAIPERMARILAARRRRRARVSEAFRLADPEKVALDTARAVAFATGSEKARALLTLARSEGPVPITELGVEREVLAELVNSGMARGLRRRSDGLELARITQRGAKLTHRALARIVADPENRIPSPNSGGLARLLDWITDAASDQRQRRSA